MPITRLPNGVLELSDAQTLVEYERLLLKKPSYPALPPAPSSTIDVEAEPQEEPNQGISPQSEDKKPTTTKKAERLPLVGRPSDRVLKFLKENGPATAEVIQRTLFGTSKKETGRTFNALASLKRQHLVLSPTSRGGPWQLVSRSK